MNPTEAEKVNRRRYLGGAIALLILNIVSSLLFIFFCDRPVYDDPNNLPDVSRYAAGGVNLDTLRHHINPTGPTSFIWMAGAVRLFGTNELRSARLGALLSWILLGAVVFVGARRSSTPLPWYGALIVTMVCPHAVTAAATVLTEGPALLFATLGVLMWLFFLARLDNRPSCILLGLVGGFSMGVAITCRQYYLALLPAAVSVALLQLHRTGQKLGAYAWTATSFAAAMIPVFTLAWVWKGLTSPGMVSGASYGNWNAKVDFNVLRPLVATFYIAFYLLAFTFPATLRLRPPSRVRILLPSALGGIGIGLFHATILQPGPLRSFVIFSGRTRTGQFMLLSLIGTLVVYNAIAMAVLLWKDRSRVLATPAVLFSLVAILVFIGEQLGIGGNIPFYERYILQIAPFLGLLSFGALPLLGYPRLVILAFLSFLSQGLLWRFAASG